MNTTTVHRARGFTLVELTVSIAVMTVLMGGIASAMFLASQAVPNGRSSNNTTLQGYHAAEQIAGELYCAQSFSVRTPTVVAFTVPDRDANNNPETIRYEWSGTPGDPLTRQYNAQSPATVADDVYQYQLDYGIRTVSETTVQLVEQYSSVELAYFAGWSGVLGIQQDLYVRTTDWVSQYFTISVPQGATQLTITKVKLMLQKDIGGTPVDVSVGIHLAKSDGSYEPRATPIGPTATIMGSTVPDAYAWTDAVFSGLTITDLGQTEYCLVVKGASVVPVWLRYQYAATAPANGIVQKWTSDGGATWEPLPLQSNQQDILFHLYGTYTLEPQQQETTVVREFLTSIDVSLQVGPDSAAQIMTSSQILDAPEVPGI